VQIFEHLASSIDTEWMRYGRDELAFPEIAQLTLDRSELASSIGPEDVFKWLIATDLFPEQFDPKFDFGNFALTVAKRHDLHIDVLLWTDSTLAIHQHGFSGAFCVLHGSSLQTL
jgi:hypothetical protein